MNLIKLFCFILLSLVALQSCDEPSRELLLDRDKHNWWHCPDNVNGFPPLDVRTWRNAPALNRRLPTEAESRNGNSLIYFDPSVYPDAKAYDIDLPMLASFSNPYTNKVDTVIVIQVVQTDLDTVVGYRYLTGGNGTYNFKSFHFLTDEEIKKAVRK